jgi:hypothetical protein
MNANFYVFINNVFIFLHIRDRIRTRLIAIGIGSLRFPEGDDDIYRNAQGLSAYASDLLFIPEEDLKQSSKWSFEQLSATSKKLSIDPQTVTKRILKKWRFFYAVGEMVSAFSKPKYANVEILMLKFTHSKIQQIFKVAFKFVDNFPLDTLENKF